MCLFVCLNEAAAREYNKTESEQQREKGEEKIIVNCYDDDDENKHTIIENMCLLINNI